MAFLAALAEWQEGLLAEEPNKHAGGAWVWKRPAWRLAIGEDGSLVYMAAAEREAPRDGSKVAPLFKRRLCPGTLFGTGGAAKFRPPLLCGKGEFFLGPDPAKRSSCLSLHVAVLGAIPDAEPLLRFLHGPSPSVDEIESLAPGCSDKVRKGDCEIWIPGPGGHLWRSWEIPAVRDAISSLGAQWLSWPDWDEKAHDAQGSLVLVEGKGGSGSLTIDIRTGEVVEAPRGIPTLKSLPGGSGQALRLRSTNTGSAIAWGADVAPFGCETAALASAAVDELCHSPTSSYSIGTGKNAQGAVVWFCPQAGKDSGEISLAFEQVFDETSDPKQDLSRAIASALQGTKAFCLPKGLEGERTVVARLAGESRLSLRWYYEGDFGDVFGPCAAYVAQSALGYRRRTQAPVSPRELVCSLRDPARREKGEKELDKGEVETVGRIVEAIINGWPYPEDLAIQAVACVLAEQQVEPEWAQILRAWLIRNRHMKEEEVTPELNPHLEGPYALGRAIAFLDSAKDAINKKENKKARLPSQDLLGLAMTCPRDAFVQATRLAQAYEEKLLKPGAASCWFTDGFSQMASLVGPPATSLDLEGQALLCLGFWMQKQEGIRAARLRAEEKACQEASPDEVADSAEA